MVFVCIPVTDLQRHLNWFWWTQYNLNTLLLPQFLWGFRTKYLHSWRMGKKGEELPVSVATRPHSCPSPQRWLFLAMLPSTSIMEQDKNQEVACWATVRVQNSSMLVHQMAYQHVNGAKCACLLPTPKVKTLLMSLCLGGGCGGVLNV